MCFENSGEPRPIIAFEPLSLSRISPFLDPILTPSPAIKRIFLVLRVLCEHSELQVAFGNEFVQLLLSLREVTHLPLQLLMPGNQSCIDSIAPAREDNAANLK